MCEEKDICCGNDESCKNGVSRQAADGQNGESCSCEKECEASGEAATMEPSAEEKYAEAQDKYLRLVAEFDNYRKRTARERMELIHSASEDTIKGLLSVVDDFERAIQAAAASEDVAALREGVALILQKLMTYLEGKGLKPIETPVGATFDTDLHDAVTKLPAPDESQKNKVIDTVQKGYKLYDKVIRYAKVVVGE
ncbi:MAG: nucleotide exchange factor GrpE [Prevotellaceae bacterium]|jgi:molecular chaperone GrpE|nr:nucleotide exchange factor GrpE [Prevotellaceae bacterium]